MLPVQQCVASQSKLPQHLPADVKPCTCRPLDVAGVMEAIHDSHEQELLPRLKEGDAVLKRFTEHCLDCKVMQWMVACTVRSQNGLLGSSI